MKVSILCGGRKAAAAAEIMQTAMYDIHGTEVRIFTVDTADELYIQGGDALVLADEGDNSVVCGWLTERGEKLSLSGLLGAAFSADGGSKQVLTLLSENNADISAGLALNGTDSAALKAFGRDIAVKTAQLVGNWSLDFD